MIDNEGFNNGHTIIERLAKIETKMEDHEVQDSQIFEELKSMSKDHYNEMKEMRNIHNENVQKQIKVTEDLTRMFAILTQKIEGQEQHIEITKTICTDRYERLGEENTVLNATIKKLGSKEINFYVWVILGAIGIILFLLKYIFKA